MKIEQARALLPYLLPPLFLLPFLGSTPLFDVDEGAFSEATREMLAQGDYLSTWLNGSPRFDKPILIYWLQALSVGLFGINEWAFRLPSALAAIGWCIVVARFAQANFGRHAGLMAGLVALTSLGVQLIGRAATADALLNLLLALSMTELWRHLAQADAHAGKRLALWCALGFLTKGPIALLIPGAAALLWTLSSRQAAPLVALLRAPLNWLIFLGLNLPWYLAAYLIHGDAFIKGFFLRHNVERFNTPLEGHQGSLFYYLLLVPLLVLPWLPWLWQCLRDWRADLNDPLKRFLWLWFGFVILFFSLSGTKLPHYALYGCTPLFILIATRHATPISHWACLPPLLVLGLMAAAPGFIELSKVEQGFYAAQFARLPEALPEHYAVLAPLLILIGTALAFSRRGRPWRRVAAIALLANLLLSACLAPLIGELLQGPIRDAARFARGIGLPVAQWQTHWPSFSVYLGAPTAIRAPLSGELALMRTDRLPEDYRFHILFQEGGVALLRFIDDIPQP